MLKITIVAVSKQKNGPWKQLADEYVKRLAPYAKVQIVEVEQARFSSANDRDRVQKQEALLIEKAIPNNAFRICLDERGDLMSSGSFAARLDEWSHSGQIEIAFMIGGPLGLHPHICSRDTDISMSLSKMTMPHDEARIVLLEQIYRAMTILTVKNYHY